MKLVTAIDLGSKKIRAAQAMIDGMGRASLVALESIDTRGIDAGDITNMQSVVESLKALVVKLERKGKKNIRKVYVTTKGRDIRIIPSRGMIGLSRVPREITEKDVQKCLDIASMVRLPLDRAVFQNITGNFYLDGQATSIPNPVGLYGMKLETETFIATGNRSKVDNITKCADYAGLLLEGIHLSSVLSAESVLYDHERENGALLIDIGNSITEVLFLLGNTLRYFSVHDVGAKDILLPDGSLNREMLRQIVGDVTRALPECSKGVSSVVITGGGALIDGLIEEAEIILKSRARIGRAASPGFSLSSQDAMVHTSTIGLINSIARSHRPRIVSNGYLHKAIRRLFDV